MVVVKLAIVSLRAGSSLLFWLHLCILLAGLSSSARIPAELVSQSPYVLKFRHLVDAKACAELRRYLFAAIAFFDDLDEEGGHVRPGGEALPEDATPRYRMQNERQLSLYFPDPPPAMQHVYEKVSQALGIYVQNIEAIYHIYAPGALPANLHMDNFNKYLFPHRFGSVSMFFDDTEDGGTVFPLVPHAGEEPVLEWHRFLNKTRLEADGDGYTGRRVELNEADVFRRQMLDEAIRMCHGGRASQGFAVPDMGTAYFWRNYKANGEDDVLTMHAGCGASEDLKVIGTFFIRDWPGPYEEHSTFWELRRPRQRELDELHRQTEILALQSFRFANLPKIYQQLHRVAGILEGEEAAERAREKHRLHQQSLEASGVGEDINAHLMEMFEKHHTKRYSWTKVADSTRAF